MAKADTTADSRPDSEIDTNDDGPYLYLDVHGEATATREQSDGKMSIRASDVVDIDVTIRLTVSDALDMLTDTYGAVESFKGDATTQLAMYAEDHITNNNYSVSNEQRRKFDVTLDGSVTTWLTVAQEVRNRQRFCEKLSNCDGIGHGATLAYGEYKRRDQSLNGVTYE